MLAYAVVCVGLVGYVLFSTSEKSTDNIGYYQALSGELEGTDMIPVLGEEFDLYCPYDLPWLSELEPYEDYRFDYTAIRRSIFQSHAYTLIVSYDAEIYQHKKAALLQDYSYLTDTFSGGGEVENHSPEFDLDGFHFRAVREDRDHADVQNMFFVGFSDEHNEIVFLYYHDQDLDYIDCSLPAFISEETGWENVKP